MHFSCSLPLDEPSPGEFQSLDAIACMVGAAEHAGIDGALAEVGVTWASTGVPAPSISDYIENIQWFGEEVAAKLR